MNLQDHFIQYLYTKGYQTKTLKSKQQYLKHYLNWTTENPLEVNETTIKNYYEFLLQSKPNVSTTQLNNYILTLKQFYSWCCKTKYIPLHPFGNFKPLPNKKATSRKPITSNKIEILIKACETTEEKLLMALGYGCGLRIGELIRLKVNEVSFEKQLVFIRKSKHNQSRNVPATYVILKQLEVYISQEKLTQTSFFFQGKKAQSLRRIFKGLQNRLGIRPYYQVHQLRHSIASHLVDNGVAINLVQQFLGHRHLKTTQNYVTLTKTIKNDSHQAMGTEISKTN